MDRLDRYREKIQNLLQAYLELSGDQQDVKTELICDTQHDHYQLVYMGWLNDRRVYGCALHLNIQDNKIWLQHNGLESDVAAELVAMGIPKTDIVLGLQLPFKRQFTEYAVG
ncbi:MAG: XisI protein [Spirulina sp. SIO3F2]|nr:XisI protein [Spirulina sp. SIO3F2]